MTTRLEEIETRLKAIEEHLNMKSPLGYWKHYCAHENATHYTTDESNYCCYCGEERYGK